MSTTETGRQAEDAIATYLSRRGHKILDRNWRTRWCEIDIISSYKGIIYFTEVKYRESLNWGGGLEYITAKKLRQMHFAAEFWLAEHTWSGEACLQAASLDASGDIELVEL